MAEAARTAALAVCSSDRRAGRAAAIALPDRAIAEARVAACVSPPSRPVRALLTRARAMPNDCWLAVRGPLPAPFTALASLYSDLSIAYGALVTHEDLEHNAITIRPVAIHRVPSVDDRDVAAASIALSLSGRITHPMHIRVVDALAPRGGLFVFEDGDVEDVPAAIDPEALLRAVRAALEDDAAALADALADVAEGDRHRLPFAAIARLAPSFDAEARDRLRGILDLCDDDAGEPPSAADVAALERSLALAEADQWAYANEATPVSARSLVVQALGGERRASLRVFSWATRLASAPPEDEEQRYALGEALLDVLETTSPGVVRGRVMEMLHELSYSEGLARISAALGDDAAYDDLLEALREHALESGGLRTDVA